MRRFIILAAVAAITVAKPETYREKEDFQYSRSSSDDGTKAGFYGAQRGNMGGNYERAHNMDKLAQHQMSTLVRQVDGELGDGAQTKTGSVYSEANSRGIYGSGSYDLTNLEGRNFQEGTTFGDSHASSLSHQSGYNSHSSSNSAAYSTSHAQNSRHHSGYNTYQSGGYSGHDLQSGNLHAADNYQVARNTDQGGQDSLAYYSNTGYHGSNDYTQSSNLHNSGGYGSNSQSRLISTVPVRIVVRPGSSVTVPIAAQTYDSAHRESSFDQNAGGSEAEILPNTYRPPSNDAKHYETSYSYKKEWEKHDTIPVVLPVSTIPKNSELYEDNHGLTSGHTYDASRLSSDNAQTRNLYSGYENHASNHQSQHQSAYNAHQASSSGSSMNAYGQHTGGSAAALNLNNQVEDFNSRPKNYQASYSYHKSWERQGDPYVIKPASSDASQTSQKLTSNDQYGSQYYGSQHHGSHTKSHQHYYNGNSEDCDENGHIRVARSYNTPYNNQIANEAQEAQNLENLGQQTQSQWDLGQQTQQQWGQLEDGQQVQNTWDNLQNLGQQTQNKMDNLEYLGQQTQSAWNLENLDQQVQTQSENLEDLGQQVQEQSENLEDLRQQAPNQIENLENLGQQAQNQWDSQRADQQTQEAWNNIDQSQHNKLDLSQQTQITWTTLQHGPQETINKNENDSQSIYKDSQLIQVNSQTDKTFTNQEIASDSNAQHSTNTFKINNNDTQSHYIPSIWGKFEENNINEQWHHPNVYQTGTNNVPQQTNDYLHQNNDFSLNTQSTGYKYEETHNNTYHQTHVSHSNWSYTNWNTTQYTEDHSHDTSYNAGTNSRGSSSLWGLWDKLDSIEKQSSINKNKDFSNNTSDNKTIIEKDDGHNNVQKNIIGDDQYNSKYKSTTSSYKLRPSDIGRGDIGPEELNDNSDSFPDSYLEITTSSTKPNTGLDAINFKIENKSENSFSNNHHNRQEIFHVPKKDRLESNNATFIHQKWFDNENNLNAFSVFQTSTIPTPNIEQVNNTLISHAMPAQTVIVEQQNKLEHDIEETKYENIHQPKNPRQMPNVEIEQQNIFDLGQKTDSFKQLRPQESLSGQQNLSPIQQNVHDQSFNQQSLDNLEQFGQKSDNFEQQNIPQETFDQQSLGNLELFGQQRDNFEQQNIPQETFDQQSLGNLEQFAQQSDNFEQQNIPQETFDQQSLGNLEQFAQQSDNFEQQNIPQETFDQQSLGNLELFGQQSDNSEQQNIPQEPFDQQNLGNSEQFGQQSDNFEQQNIPQEIFGQQNLGNSEQFGQQSDNFEQQNIPKETFDQQNLDSLQQFAQQNVNLDKQNMNNDDLVIPHLVNKNQFTPYVSPDQVDESDKHLNHETQTETFQQETDYLVRPLQVKPQNQKNEDQLQELQQTNIQDNVNNQQTQRDNQEKQGRENYETFEQSKDVQKVDATPEPVTEKPGFWKSVGNKFVSAKDKVASWFSRS